MRNYIPKCLLVLMVFLIMTSVSFAKVQEHRIYRVAKVIDGDTFRLTNGDCVRLIGIDAPEMKDNPKLQKDLQERHLSKEAELAMGRRSYAFTKHLIAGKKIRLAFDKDRMDEYHRVLAYAYLTNGVFVNAKIVESGYAYPYMVKPDFKHARLFNRLYKEAVDHHRGLWQNPNKKSFKWFSN